MKVKRKISELIELSCQWAADNGFKFFPYCGKELCEVSDEK